MSLWWGCENEIDQDDDRDDYGADIILKGNKTFAGAMCLGLVMICYCADVRKDPGQTTVRHSQCLKSRIQNPGKILGCFKAGWVLTSKYIVIKHGQRKITALIDDVPLKTSIYGEHFCKLSPALACFAASLVHAPGLNMLHIGTNRKNVSDSRWSSQVFKVVTYDNIYQYTLTYLSIYYQ